MTSGSADNGAWKEQAGFQFYIFNIRKPTEYFVESNGIKSQTYKLDVADLPYVKQLDVVINFPSYTGLPSKTIEDSGEIAALQGSVVRITARLTAKAKGARIVLKDGEKIEMTAEGEKDFAGNVTVTRIRHITSSSSVRTATYNGSSEFDIVLLDDQPPTVSFEKPGRDARATSVEEIFTEAKAEDDYGVASLEMFFSVNGGEEKKVDLQQLQREASRTMKATHTFFLEEYGLDPGTSSHTTPKRVTPVAKLRVTSISSKSNPSNVSSGSPSSLPAQEAKVSRRMRFPRGKRN